MSIYNSAIDPDAHPAELQDLPGNILTAHAREFVALATFRFAADPRAARTLARRLGCLVTSAHEQRRTYLHWKKTRTPEPAFHGFALTRSGYAALGINTLDAGLPTEAPADPFTVGMRAREPNLSPPTGDRTWESEYRDQTIDGVVLVADWSEAGCARALAALLKLPEWTAAITWTHTEQGRSYRNEAGQRVEHFGYADGLSQPLFLTDEIAEAASQAPAGQPWNPAMPAAAMVVAPVRYPANPSAGAALRSGFGSYLVFRKLEQDVAGFAASCGQLAATLDPAKPDPDFAGACLLGRFPDGTPLTLSARAQPQTPPRNDFDYRGDFPPTRCPMHAHVRKANGRTEATNGSQIVRRGITYGKRAVLASGALDPSQQPRSGVGLLFMAHMRHLDQFEEMQGRWLNTDFPSNRAGATDPIAGHASPPATLQVPVQWGQPTVEPAHKLTLAHFVTPRGGAYFFAPPLGFLQSLQ